MSRIVIVNIPSSQTYRSYSYISDLIVERTSLLLLDQYMFTVNMDSSP
jgi:hypothetical protein